MESCQLDPGHGSLPISCLLAPCSQTSFLHGSTRHSCLGWTSLQLFDQRKKEYLSPTQVWKLSVTRHWLNWLGPCAYPGMDRCAQGSGEQKLTQLGLCGLSLKHFTISSPHMILRIISPKKCLFWTKYWKFYYTSTKSNATIFPNHFRPHSLFVKKTSWNTYHEVGTARFIWSVNKVYSQVPYINAYIWNLEKLM